MRKTAIVLLLLLLACGASARQRTISAAFTTTNASQAAFVAFDQKHQAHLVAKATSLEDGRQLLDDYRRKREPVVQAFAAVYKLIAAATLTNDARSITDMIAAASLLHAALADLGVSP